VNKIQLLILFGIALAGATTGSSIGGLMPVYAAQLGANANQTGFFLSAAFTGLAAGTLAAGRVPGRPGNRRAVLVMAALLSTLLLLLLGQVRNMNQLVLLTTVITFLEGLQIATVSILAGMQAIPAERGRVFGILGSAATLGVLLSGLAGAVVLRWGFSGLFSAAAFILFLRALAGLMVVDFSTPAKQAAALVPPASQQTGKAHFRGSPGLGRSFLFLILASTLAFSTGGIYNLARALGMIQTGFDAAAISSTIAVGGLVALPFPLLMGWLSDRIGRRSLLEICYAAGAVGLLLLAVSTQLWHIWLSSAFQAIMTASMSIGAALVTDLVPKNRLGTGLSLFNATSLIGMIIGSALAGAAIQRLGITPVLVFAVILALLSIGLIIPIRQTVVAVTATADVSSDGS
jgi:MFS family permease